MIKGTAVTPVGTFKIDRERPDGWWIGDLGQIYRPKYFVGGVAIHGSMSVPAYPASHGCVRVTVKAMDFIWDNNILPRGTQVLVYGEIN
jgi:lipoprotein-anchoring transpeptidase ErfK/SrfK